jgi:hypothetical protein
VIRHVAETSGLLALRAKYELALARSRFSSVNEWSVKVTDSAYGFVTQSLIDESLVSDSLRAVTL